MSGLRSRLDSLETESFRKQLGNVGLPRSILSLKKDRCIRTEFVDHLTTSTAGRTRNAMVVDHRDRTDLNLRTELCDCGKNCRALSTIGHSVGCVLYIATIEDFAVG